MDKVGREGGGGDPGHTVWYFVYMYLTVVELLRVRAERNLRVAEKVFAHLCLAETSEVLFIAIDGSS